MTAEEFTELVDRAGLRPSKLAEILGKKPGTIRLYKCGERAVPKLVAEKVKKIAELIESL